MTDLPDLLYMRARYYLPSVGRFINKDPIGLGGGMNMYGYVGGNPVRFIDPEGLFYGFPDYMIGTGLVLGGIGVSVTGNPFIGIPMIIGGSWFLIYNPISEFAIKPIIDAAHRVVDLENVRIREYEEVYRQCGLE